MTIQINHQKDAFELIFEIPLFFLSMILARYVIRGFFHDSLSPFFLLEYNFILVDPKPKCQVQSVF